MAFPHPPDDPFRAAWTAARRLAAGRDRRDRVTGMKL